MKFEMNEVHDCANRLFRVIGFKNDAETKKLCNNYRMLERVCIEFAGGVHNHTSKPHDGFNPVSIKIQECKIETELPFLGRGTCNSILTIERLEHLIRTNPDHIVAGINNDEFQYMVKFDLSKSNVADTLRRNIESRMNGATTAPKFNWTDYLHIADWVMVFPWTNRKLFTKPFIRSILLHPNLIKYNEVWQRPYEMFSICRKKDINDVRTRAAS